MRAILKSPAYQLERVTKPGLTGPDRLMLNPRTAQGAGVGLFVAYPGDPGESCLPCRLVTHTDMPENLIVAHASVLERLALPISAKAGWELRIGTASLHVAERLSLELMVNQALESFADRVSRDQSLAGMLLYLPAGQGAGTLSFEAGDEPVRVREIYPSVDGDAIYELDADTTAVTLLAPPHRAAVDIVILADCSGSMAFEDLTISEEAPPTTSLWGSVFGRSRTHKRTQSRSDALVHALTDLLDRRLLSAGTVSRIALLAFGNICQIRFPRGSERQGMIEIDESTPEEIRDQFRQAIKDLMPERQWGTDIGQALQFAASHLSNFGKPGNERLIVLISDGAHWQAKGEEGSGELLDNVLSEPVSLMETLNTRMNIHLHAIGISNPEIYERWVRSDPARDPQRYLVTGSIPNHKLLEELVRVGGGDPARTGDTSVLDDYLRRLGEGVTRRATLMKRRTDVTPTPSPDELEAIAKVRQGPALSTQATTSELLAIRDQIKEHYRTCNEFARGLSGGHSLFQASPEAVEDLFDHAFLSTIRSEREFRLFQIDINKVLDEGLADEIRCFNNSVRWPEPFPKIKQYLHDGNYGYIAALRHPSAHDPARNPRTARSKAEALRFFVGVPAIAANDGERWAQLQLEVSRFVLKSLIEIEQILCEAQTQPRPSAPETEIHW